MLTNLVLIIGILCVLIFSIYDQFIMPNLKGETKLSIPLQRQVKADAWIFIGLVGLSIAYGIQNAIEPLTLYLLCFAILLAIYVTFLRFPRLLLKESGFFFANIFFDYQTVAQINLADQQILVIDLKSGRRLLIRIQQAEDIEKVVSFFGGYKED